MSPFTPVDLPDVPLSEEKGNRYKRAAIQVNTEKGSHRNYPPDKIARLAELLGKDGFEVFLVGNASHPSLPSRREGIHNCIGRTATPLELAGLLRHMDVIVTPDSLSAHIGGTLGIPTVVLFNVTGREKTDHYPSVTPLCPGRPCSPCYDLFHCPEGYGSCRALDDAELSPEAILEKVVELTGHRGDDWFDQKHESSKEVRVQ
jgi:ADP-heptose:LPS heptosyltransferase